AVFCMVVVSWALPAMAASSNHPLSNVTAFTPPTVAGRRSPADYVQPIIGATTAGTHTIFIASYERPVGPGGSSQ
ncbi:MAG: hypothetical protein ACP5QA_15230, partial [Phycisphaerae bacterium]